MDGHADGGASGFPGAPPRGTSLLPVRRGVLPLRPDVAPTGADVGEALRASDVGVLPAPAEPLPFGQRILETISP